MDRELDLARSLMEEFAGATGITGGAPPRRYLWTDAFAVCNFLGLQRLTGEDRYLVLAADLVDQVHRVLGRHRPDDPRKGWISGLSEEEGGSRPTAGGLRIGKPLNERAIGQPQDTRLEWEQDGQYFHYLTKWIHALVQMGRATGQERYRRWAVDLALAACRGFRLEDAGGGPPRLAWKMSIDLSRPLVDSTGQHDALDGLVTCLELETARDTPPDGRSRLSGVVAELAGMCGNGAWATADPLGIGGLLEAATRLAQLVSGRGVEGQGLVDLLDFLVREAGRSLEAFAGLPVLHQPAGRRLAFRELGLAIGLHGVPILRRVRGDGGPGAFAVAGLARYVPLAGAIQSFWSNPVNRACRAWTDHGDINAVMLATSLLPESFLEIGPEWRPRALREPAS